MSHLCLNMGHFGLNMPGTMAEYYVVRQDRALRISDQIDFPTGSLAEPVSVCLEALSQARLKPGNSLLIVGDGPFGILMSRLAEALDLSRVVIVGRQDFRLGFAGQAFKINDQHISNPIQIIRDECGGLGYDAAILAVGTPEAFSTCQQCLKPKGRLVVFSALPGDTPVDLFSVHIKELEIVGACNDQDRFAEAVRMLSNPVLGISKFITHHFPLSEFKQALHMAEFGQDQAMKVSFVF
jgi:threonine dehydrogenase-like Zn-dependent dehydrogenase